MRNRLFLLLALLASLALGAPAAAETPALIVLRRGAFDPLSASAARGTLAETAVDSSLRLVQLNAAPDDTTRARLAASGMTVLAYIPDNTFLVRAAANVRSTAEVRWQGALSSADKIPAALDAALTSAASRDLLLVSAPDRDGSALAQAVRAAGGTVLSQAALATGTHLRVTLSGAALRGLLSRDDLVWAEPRLPMLRLNDKGRAIMGVDTARAAIPGLDGSGQIVAVSDTGLDIQSDVLGGQNPDFPASRIAAGITPSQIYPENSNCADTSAWDDADTDSHGTHVAGTVLGGGARSINSRNFGGVAPGARLVPQRIQSEFAGTSGSSSLDCLDDGTRYLELAYAAGARVQNGSFGTQDRGTYTADAAAVDLFLWQHPEHLFVVAAGNAGADSNRDGVVDLDSIGSPGTAKNVLSVGASETNCADASLSCYGGVGSTRWGDFSTGGGQSAFPTQPLNSDLISNNISGMAAFSSRGPTDDGRIKPEIVAPGVNILSAASHRSPAQSNTQLTFVTDNYFYLSGTSMASPMVSGSAALIRQWLVQYRNQSAPSAALVKALLLNGAVNLSPGQYGSGSGREIPAAWPNAVEGWGRVAVDRAVGVTGSRVWFTDNRSGLSTAQTASYPLTITAGQPTLRVTLSWTDYPASPLAGRTLQNDLNLELVAPDGTIIKGNNAVSYTGLSATCRLNGADRCNPNETVELNTPAAGNYTIRVIGGVIPSGPQPFALAANGGVAPAAPTNLRVTGSSGAAVTLAWDAVSNASSYQLEVSSGGALVARPSATSTGTTLLLKSGSYSARVNACDPFGCGSYSSAITVTSAADPLRLYAPYSWR